jgi:hypothetical protein
MRWVSSSRRESCLPGDEGEGFVHSLYVSRNSYDLPRSPLVNLLAVNFQAREVQHTYYLNESHWSTILKI